MASKYEGLDKEYWHTTMKKDKTSVHCSDGSEVGLVPVYLKKMHSPILHAFLQESLFLPDVRPGSAKQKFDPKKYCYSESYENDYALITIQGIGYLDSVDFFHFAKIMQILHNNGTHTLTIKENDLMKECEYEPRDFYETRKQPLRDSLEKLANIKVKITSKERNPEHGEGYSYMRFSLMPSDSYCAKTKTYHFEFHEGLFYAYHESKSWQAIDLELYNQTKVASARILYLFIESKFNRNNKAQKRLNVRRNVLAERLGYDKRGFATTDITKGIKNGLDTLIKIGYLSKYYPVPTDRDNPTYNIYPVRH